MKAVKRIIGFFKKKSDLSEETVNALRELVDGAYDVMFLWKPDGPYNTKWKEEWLIKARGLGFKLE